MCVSFADPRKGCVLNGQLGGRFARGPKVGTVGALSQARVGFTLPCAERLQLRRCVAICLVASSWASMRSSRLF